MLVLARKLNESFMISDDIEVIVIEIKGDQVKLGIKAPKSIPVYRKEIYLDIKEENIKASRSSVHPQELINIENILKKKTKDSSKKKEDSETNS